MGEFRPLGLHRTRIIPFLAMTFWRLGVFGKLPPSSLTSAKVPDAASLGVASRTLPDQANTAGLSRCPSSGDGWCLDRKFQRSNGLDKSPSLTAHFTGFKTEGQRVKGLTQTSCCPPTAEDPEGQLPNLLEHSKCIEHICSRDRQ